jgi:hypothetical protein
MKVKCIRLLDTAGLETEHSSWLSLGCVYHLLSMFIDATNKRSYGVVSHEQEGEWPNIESHPSECFEIVSTVIPTNWRLWLSDTSDVGVSPLAWQELTFIERFFERDPSVYPIYVRERDVIAAEDP